MEKPCILIIEHQNWNNCNRRHLYKEMSADFKIVFVEPKTFVIPMPKMWRQWTKALMGAKYIHDGIISFTPFSFLRFLRFKPLLNLELFLYTTQIKRVLKSFNLSCDILWLCGHEEGFLLGKLGEKVKVCRIFDDHTQYPGFPKNLKEEYYKNEEKFYQSVDVVFAVSQKLYYRARKVNPRTYYLPNASDSEHFRKIPSQDTTVPEDIKSVPKPVIGFIGKINERLNGEILNYLISSKPEWSFVMIGPIDTISEDFRTRFKEIIKRNNVYYLGKKSYEDMPNYLKFFDVCIIPYVTGEVTEAVNPIKIYEYVATNKPVVMTPISESSIFSEVAKIAKSPEELCECIENCLKENNPETVKKRSEFSERNTWQKRANEIKFYLKNLL